MDVGRFVNVGRIKVSNKRAQSTLDAVDVATPSGTASLPRGKHVAADKSGSLQLTAPKLAVGAAFVSVAARGADGVSTMHRFHVPVVDMQERTMYEAGDMAGSGAVLRVMRSGDAVEMFLH